MAEVFAEDVEPSLLPRSSTGPITGRMHVARTQAVHEAIHEAMARDNAILWALPDEDRLRLLVYSRAVRLAPGRTLIQAGAEISWVFLPTDGMVSHITDDGRGASVEVGLTGTEGMVGARAPLFRKDSFANVSARAMTRGWALGVPVPTFLQELARSGSLRDLVQSFVSLQFTQAVQELVCNRAHRSDRRLARWLLQAEDRSPDGRFSMTQDFISQVLGVRRVTITEAIGSLRQTDLVRTRRGVVTIVDREGLERAACDCYPILAEALRGHLEV